MKRARLRKKIILYHKGTKAINVIIWLIILLAISILVVLNIVNRKVSPILLNYAEIETRKLASIVISKAINHEVAQGLNVDDLFIIHKREDGEIQTIDFNPVVVNELLLKATTAVQINLKYLEDGEIDKLELGENALINYDPDNLRKGIFYKIPAGVVFNNSLLANLGPKIPVRFSLLGDIVANVVSKVTNYGINNALIEVQMNLKLNEQVILPITTSSITIEVNVPISLKIVQGVVPEYYFNGFTKNSSSFELPVE